MNRQRQPNLLPEPTAADPFVCGSAGDSLLPRLVGPQSPAAAAQQSVGCKRMRAFLFLAALLFWIPANAGKLPDLHQVRTSEDLAKFIYQMTTNQVGAQDLLWGLSDRGTVHLLPTRLQFP